MPLTVALAEPDSLNRSVSARYWKRNPLVVNATPLTLRSVVIVISSEVRFPLVITRPVVFAVPNVALMVPSPEAAKCVKPVIVKT